MVRQKKHVELETFLADSLTEVAWTAKLPLEAVRNAIVADVNFMVEAGMGNMKKTIRLVRVNPELWDWTDEHYGNDNWDNQPTPAVQCW